MPLHLARAPPAVATLLRHSLARTMFRGRRRRPSPRRRPTQWEANICLTEAQHHAHTSTATNQLRKKEELTLRVTMREERAAENADMQELQKELSAEHALHLEEREAEVEGMFAEVRGRCAEMLEEQKEMHLETLDETKMETEVQRNSFPSPSLSSTLASLPSLPSPPLPATLLSAAKHPPHRLLQVMEEEMMITVHEAFELKLSKKNMLWEEQRADALRAREHVQEKRMEHQLHIEARQVRAGGKSRPATPLPSPTTPLSSRITPPTPPPPLPSLPSSLAPLPPRRWRWTISATTPSRS